MRVFETALDLCVLPGIYMVARLDGRSFTRLTKEVHQFEAPFDIRFRDMMLATAEHLMTACGFSFVYGYTQNDEISLLFALDDSRITPCSSATGVNRLASKVHRGVRGRSRSPLKVTTMFSGRSSDRM